MRLSYLFWGFEKVVNPEFSELSMLCLELFPEAFTKLVLLTGVLLPRWLLRLSSSCRGLECESSMLLVWVILRNFCLSRTTKTTQSTSIPIRGRKTFSDWKSLRCTYEIMLRWRSAFKIVIKLVNSVWNLYNIPNYPFCKCGNCWVYPCCIYHKNYSPFGLKPCILGIFSRYKKTSVQADPKCT